MGGCLMKILNVYGSSIDGSRAAIADRFLEKAGRLGATLQSFALGGANITSCKKCMSCKTTTDKCVIEDDITTIFNSLVTCNVLVLSTGIYSGDVTGNMDIFESRLFSLLKQDFETNPDPSRLSSGKNWYSFRPRVVLKTGMLTYIRDMKRCLRNSGSSISLQFLQTLSINLPTF
ncbi:MAG: flavodoxin family protein [Syntrophobacterales bacterium]|nr:MAG: flavodoxin family protein [Syntrophobacterales bacterium]